MPAADIMIMMRKEASPRDKSVLIFPVVPGWCQQEVQKEELQAAEHPELKM